MNMNIRVFYSPETRIAPHFSLSKVLAILLIFLVMTGPIFSQDRDISKRFSFTVEVGNWQPHSLNDEPRFDTFGAAGATPFFGLALCAPLGGGLGLRLSVGFWSLRDLEEVETVHSLVLHPLFLDLKYWLIPNYRLSAYVTYGAGVIWGTENETEPFGERLRNARAGWGANLGAGFDLALSSSFGLGMAFHYHYVRFNKPLGGVEDFSGPRITGMFFFFL
ncbi:hypothetical protein ACFL6A_02785 [bacterium]